MKKTISIIIAAMMLISLVPCAIAAELEVKYNFDFGAKGYEGIVAAPEDGKWEEWIKSNGDSETPVWAETGTDPWFLDGSRYVYGNNFELTGSTGSGDQMPDSVYWPMYAKRAYENGAKK